MNGEKVLSITVLTFGPLAETLGWKRKEFEFFQNTRIEEAVRILGLPSVQLLGLLFAVNGVQCSSETVLQTGDELALLPPVSGG
jgi:molybdopterin converting factor small subunit